MKRGFDRIGATRDDARRLGVCAKRRRHNRLLRRDDRLRWRSDADPIVFDAETSRVAMLDALLRAFDRRHEDDR